MTYYSTPKSKFLIHAWIWEACIALDYKDEVYKIEEEIEGIDSLRKYFIDDKNTSLLLAIRKLEDILERLYLGKEIIEVLTKLQSLTIFLIRDRHLQSEMDIVKYLFCFHHYCVLMIYEAMRKFEGDILLQTLPLNFEKWEKVKGYFRFEDDRFKADFILTLEEFHKCKKGMGKREKEGDLQRFLEYMSSIQSKLTKFCSELRKLLLTPTLVKIYENDIEYIYYKNLDIPKIDLVLREIKHYGVTRDCLRIVFDLLLKSSQNQMNLSNSEELSPTIGLDFNVAKAWGREKRMSTESIISGTTSSSTLSPYGTQCLSSFVDKQVQEDVYVQNPVCSVTEQNTEIGELITEQNAEIGELITEQNAEIGELITKQNAEIGELITEQNAEIGELITEQNAEIGELSAEHVELQPESLDAIEKEPHLKSNENMTESLSIEPQMNNQELFLHDNVQDLESFLRDATKLSKIVGILKSAAARLVTSCSEFEEAYSEVCQLVSCMSEDQMKNKLVQCLRLFDICKESENVCRVEKLCESDSTLIRSMNRDQECSKRDNESNDDICTDSELSMPILTPQVKLGTKNESDKTLEEDSMHSLSPQRESTSFNTEILVNPLRNSSVHSTPLRESTGRETFEETILCMPNTALNKSNDKQVFNTTTNFTPQSISNDAESNNRIFPEMNVTSEQQDSDISLPTASNKSNKEQDLDISSPNTALNKSNDKQVFNTTNNFTPQSISNDVESNERISPVMNVTSEQQDSDISLPTAPNTSNKEQDLDISSPNTALNKSNDKHVFDTTANLSPQNLSNDVESNERISPVMNVTSEQQQQDLYTSSPNLINKSNKEQTDISTPSPPNKSNKQETLYNSSLTTFNACNEKVSISSPSQLNESNELQSLNTLYITMSDKDEQQSLDNSLHTAKMSCSSEPNEKSILNEQSFDVNESFERPTTNYSPPLNPPSKLHNKKGIGKNFLKESKFDTCGNDEQQANNLSKDYSPQCESFYDGTREKRNLSISVSENEVQTFDISPRNSSQNKDFEGGKLEISSLSGSFDVSENSKDLTLKISPCSNSQNQSFKGEVTKKYYLNKSSSFKESIEEQGSDISLQESLSSNDTTFLKQQLTIEAPNPPSDSKLKFSPYVLLTPLKNPPPICSDTRDTLNSSDHKIKGANLIDEVSNSPSIIDNTKENPQMDSEPSTSQFRQTPTGENQTHTDSLNYYQLKRLSKRRKLMLIDTSYSEEEV